MKQAIAPMGECRHDRDICDDLARRLGLPAEAEKTEDQWLRELAGPEIDDWEAFRAAGLARLSGPAEPVAFAAEVQDPAGHPFSTPSGKIEIYSATLAASPDPCGLGPIPPIPTWIPPHQPDPRHPLQCVSPKSRARTHSTHDNQEILSRADPQDVWIHPADAAARGIADGQPARVFNDRGATVLPARVTERIAPGVVSIKEGAWFTPDGGGTDTRGAANVLTEDRAAPCGATTFNSCLVQIEAVR
jgi:anaerobic dimethyl sulfoxide reductase subunit A